MIERLELDNDFPGYFGLREGGILAVRAGLGSSSIGGDTTEAETRRVLHNRIFRKIDNYYIAVRTSLNNGSVHEVPTTPMWFGAIEEGEMVMLGLRVYARHNRLPSELSENEAMKLQIAATMVGVSTRDQLVDQVLSDMQAEELIAQIQGFRQYLA
jgi:hypothetical protein